MRSTRKAHTVFTLRSELRGRHIHTTVFAGPPDQTKANCGTIVTSIDRVGEWQSFGAALQLGAVAMGGDIVVLCEGDDEVCADLDRLHRGPLRRGRRGVRGSRQARGQTVTRRRIADDSGASTMKEPIFYGSSSDETYIVRFYDHFDGWIDLSGELPKEKAVEKWNEHTSNGTRYCDPSGSADYVAIFPSRTRMIYTPELRERS